MVIEAATTEIIVEAITQRRPKARDIVEPTLRHMVLLRAKAGAHSTTGRKMPIWTQTGLLMLGMLPMWPTTMTTNSKLQAGWNSSLKLRFRGHRRWPHRQHPQHQEARLCPDRHLPSCRGMRSRLCSEEGHVSQRRLDDIPCLWPPLCNSLYNSLPPFPVSGEAACTCLEGKPATWAEDITKTARSTPYVVSLLHVSAPSAVSLPA